MSDPHAHPPTSVEHWDERYSGEPTWSGDPNGALIAEVAGLTPGRALDIGCGEGADAVWLAQQGWEVTALDISPNAVALTQAAERAGVSVTGMAAGFVSADLPAAGFDLVSAMYPVLERTADQRAERRLAELVAPGGTLLLVNHEIDPAHVLDGHEGFDPMRFLDPAAVRASLGPGREVVVNEARERHVAGGAGAGHRWTWWCAHGSGERGARAVG